MKLTDKAIKALESKEKQYKVSDGQGLYVLVHPNGSKYWKLKYRIHNKEKALSIGKYPEVSLAEAREEVFHAKKQLKEGIDLSQKKQLDKLMLATSASNSFEEIAREWHDNQKDSWTERHANYVLRRIEADLFGPLGNRPISEIKSPELLAVLRLVEKRGAIDIAKRLLQTSGQIFRYAVATGKTDRDITSDLKGALKTRVKTNYSYLRPEEFGEFCAALEKYKGEYQTKLGLKLLIHTFVRTKELRGAKWDEISFETRLWKIPAIRMKMRKEHWIPLSAQVIEILHEIKAISSGSEYLFPNVNNPRKFMSENTLLYAMYRLGYHGRATVHGFRATASTILNENEFNRDHIELQLAHSPQGTRASYNHAQYLEQRRDMMQWYSDFIDSFKPIN